MSIAETHPLWWSPKHTSAWERTKAAVRRDWEQTKHDMTGGGHDLNQHAGQTVRQVSGKSPMPFGNAPNLPDAHDIARHARDDAKATLKDAKSAAADDVQAAKAGAAADVRTAKDHAAASTHAANARETRWEESEKAVRYGFGAALAPHREWSATQPELRKEWAILNGTRTWDDAESDVKHGWEAARKIEN
jgi:hypothetical protein